MRKHIVNIILALLLLYSCSNEHQKHVAGDTIYQKIDVDCYEGWNGRIWYDTTFSNNITFKLSSRCRNEITFTDTIPDKAGTFFIRNWYGIEFEIKFSPSNKTITLYKASFFENLSDDLKEHGVKGAEKRLLDPKGDPNDPTNFYFDTIICDLRKSDIEKYRFVSTPKELVFNQADTSVTFRILIGHVEHNYGDMFVLKIDRNGNASIISVEMADQYNGIL